MTTENKKGNNGAQEMKENAKRFPRLKKGILPAPVPLLKMVGPSVVLVAAAIGSGEFVLWPYLTVNYGYSIWWACMMGISIQFFVNTEIMRWTLATGETVITSFSRISKYIPYAFFLMTFIPFMWPGWATGASTLLVWSIGGNALYYSIGGLILIGIIFTLGPVLYNILENIQKVFVALILVLTIFFVIVTFKLTTVGEVLKGSFNILHIPEGLDISVLLAAVAYAGAGGAINLIQSNYIREKKWGMCVHVPQLTSPITGRKEPTITSDGQYFEFTEENMIKWKVWWKRANYENLIVFLIFGIFSLVALSMISYNLVFEQSGLGEDFDFLKNVGNTLSAVFAGWAGRLFWFLGVIALFSTEMVILDVVARISAEIFKGGILKNNDTLSFRTLYYIFLWGAIVAGIIILMLGIDQPLMLLVISAVLNGMVMAVYSILLLYFNRFVIWRQIRMGGWRTGALIFAVLFYGYFTILVLFDQIPRLF